MLPRSRSENQETMISSNDSEGGSTELDHRLSSRMSMRSCPAGKGSRTWIAEVFTNESDNVSYSRWSWARLSGGTIVVPLKSVVSQRWNVMFATTAIEISHRLVRARSPRVLPRFLRTMGLLPHTHSTILGVRAFAPRSGRVFEPIRVCLHLC